MLSTYDDDILMACLDEASDIVEMNSKELELDTEEGRYFVVFVERNSIKIPRRMRSPFDVKPPQERWTRSKSLRRRPRHQTRCTNEQMEQIQIVFGSPAWIARSCRPAISYADPVAGHSRIIGGVDRVMALPERERRTGSPHRCDLFMLPVGRGSCGDVRRPTASGAGTRVCARSIIQRLQTSCRQCTMQQ